MDPAESVENIFGKIFSMNAIYGISYVLSGGNDQTEGYKYQHCYRIVQTKHRGIYVNMVDFDEDLQTTKDVQHCSSIFDVHGGSATDL